MNERIKMNDQQNINFSCLREEKMNILNKNLEITQTLVFTASD